MLKGFFDLNLDFEGSLLQKVFLEISKWVHHEQKSTCNFAFDSVR